MLSAQEATGERIAVALFNNPCYLYVISWNQYHQSELHYRGLRMVHHDVEAAMGYVELGDT